MTKAGARLAADLILLGAGLAAVCVVLTTPPLRRLAGTAVKSWLGAGLPAFAASEVRRAWAESAPGAHTVTSRIAS